MGAGVRTRVFTERVGREGARVDGEREGNERVLTRECARDRRVPMERACLGGGVLGSGCEITRVPEASGGGQGT